MSAPDLRRLLAEIVQEELRCSLWVPRSYRVQTVHDDGRCDLVPVDDGPPELPYVDQWAGQAGGVAVPVEGSTVVVQFLDGDPRRPAIVNYQPLRLEGGTPDESTIDAVAVKLGPTSSDVELAGGDLPVARQTDRVVALAFGPIAGLWVQPNPGDAWIPVATNPHDSTPAGPDPSFTGTVVAITGGSSKVSSG